MLVITFLLLLQPFLIYLYGKSVDKETQFQHFYCRLSSIKVYVNAKPKYCENIVGRPFFRSGGVQILLQYSSTTSRSKHIIHTLFQSTVISKKYLTHFNNYLDLFSNVWLAEATHQISPISNVLGYIPWKNWHEMIRVGLRRAQRGVATGCVRESLVG